MENKELLEKVVKNRLERSLSNDGGTDEDKELFQEAMDAIDRYLEYEKVETAKKEQKPNRFLRYAEIVVMPLLVAGVTYLCKKDLAKVLMQFEKEDSFTSTPARSMSGWFKF